ncbi:hypothetical protein KM043_012488 [Ampulex compressa]|nr:hypothetical protein KM043_012488 [Ampulex compressa]
MPPGSRFWDRLIPNAGQATDDARFVMAQRAPAKAMRAEMSVVTARAMQTGKFFEEAPPRAPTREPSFKEASSDSSRETTSFIPKRSIEDVGAEGESGPEGGTERVGGPGGWGGRGGRLLAEGRGGGDRRVMLDEDESQVECTECIRRTCLEASAQTETGRSRACGESSYG